MAIRNIILSGVVLAGTLGWAAAVWAQEGVLLKVALTTEGNYCHLKFPAIREETLSWDRPVLKDPGEGDVIDFYGPCNHEPLGEAEVQSQQLAYTRDLNRDADED